MGKNLAEEALDKRLVNEVKGLRRDINDLKTSQPIGADIISVASAPSTGALFGGPFTVAAGSATTVIIQITPFSGILTLWNYLYTVYVDGSATDDAFPSGINLTAAKRNVIIMNWIDWADSSDTSNIRMFKIRIRNEDTASHDYYLRFRAYLPKTAVTV